jgi:hypothetical protein
VFFSSNSGEREEESEGDLEKGEDQGLKDSMKCRYMIFYLCFVYA